MRCRGLCLEHQQLDKLVVEANDPTETERLMKLMELQRLAVMGRRDAVAE